MGGDLRAVYNKNFPHEDEHTVTISQGVSGLRVCSWILTSPRTVSPEENAGEIDGNQRGVMVSLNFQLGVT